MKKEQIKILDELSSSLEGFYSELTNDDILKKVLILMHHKGTRELIETFLENSEDEDFIYELNEDTGYAASYIRLLKNILKISNYIYNYTGNTTGLSDSEYDELSEFYKEISGDESIITETKEDSSNVHHKYKTLRGTLDKIYKITEEDVLKNKSQKSLDDWVKQTEKRYFEATGENINLYNEDIIVMPKFDGVSTVFECDGKTGNMIRALTRGDTSRNEAQDITHIFEGVFHGSLEGQERNYGEKVEVMMLDQSLIEYNEKYHKDYKNTRSIVSSILNSKEKDERVDYLHVVPLRISYLDDGEESLQELAPEVYNYPYLKCKLNELDKIHESAFNNKTVYPGLRCDGAVIQLLNPKVQKALGRENEKQKYEVAFKFTEEVGYSEVKDVEFTAGLFGRMNPVVVFKPVKLKGNEVSRASLGSYARFKELELCKGDVIKVLYDIIPYVQYDPDDYHCERSGKNVIEAPVSCPDCGELLELSETGDILRCVNPKCPCRQKGKILNFCKKMNISNISYATIDDFYKEGLLCTIEDLYHLEENRDRIVNKIDGYSDKKFDNIVSEINSHKDVTPSMLFGSLGIESISVKKFQTIFKYISVQEMLDIANDRNIDFFTVIPGIKEKTSLNLILGLHENKDLIDFLLDKLNLTKEVSGSFNVAFTKVRDDGMEQFIRDCGGFVQDSLTKETNILVVPVLGINSMKVEKAKKYGIPVIPIGELKPYIKKNYL